MRTLGCLIFALCVAAPMHASADYEETERRLKAVGVDDAMRNRIHKAIEKGVEYLLRHQKRDGSFATPGAVIYGDYAAGYTALCALALRHAGTPRAVAGVTKSLDYLFKRPDKHEHEVSRRVYTAGLAAMLVMADGRHREEGVKLGHAIAKAIQARSGWWGYRIREGRYGDRHTTPDIANLSTTQFAGLGLWAAQRLKAPVDVKVWRDHLNALLVHQTKEGSWTYVPFRRDAAGRSLVTGAKGYPTGTFMGLANLLLAEKALAKHLSGNIELRKRLIVAKHRALGALERDGRAFLSDRPAPNNVHSFYSLYALEKACLFAGRERLGNVPWYHTGATYLLENQNKDGGWGISWAHKSRSTLSDTAFALLFLLRSSEAYRPTTPSPVDKPSERVVTPSAPK